MNEVIKLITNHRSIRQYEQKPVTDSQVEMIIKAAVAAPNWNNAQHVTIIEVRDPDRKEKLSELVGNQIWVKQAPVFFVFCLDFYRTKLAAEKNNLEIKIMDSIEAIILGSTDVGIALANSITAAESMGLGTVPIGGIRRKPHEVIKLLNLPEYVFPISGLVVGHPSDFSAKKPRLPQEAVHHKEEYNHHHLSSLIDQYDETVSTYMVERTNGAQSRNWTDTIANYYSNIMLKNYQHGRPTLEQQGFKLE